MAEESTSQAKQDSTIGTTQTNSGQGAARRLGSDAAGQSAQENAKPQDTSPLVVDGREVSEEEYFKAASKQYDVTHLRERNYFPPISTK